MGKRGMNIRSRKKIEDALDVIHSPFSSIELAHMTGLEVRRVSCLLRDNSRLEKIKMNRSRGIRVMYNIIPVLS